MQIDARSEVEQLGSLIGNTRKYLGLNQDHVARRIGVGRPTMSQMETGARLIGALELKKIAETFRLPINYFLSDPEGVTPTSGVTEITKDLPDDDKERLLSYASYLRMGPIATLRRQNEAAVAERQRIVQELGVDKALEIELATLDDEARSEFRDFAEYRRSKLSTST